MEPKDRIILALDVDEVSEASRLVRLLASHVGLFKIGLEFITAMLVSLIASGQEEAQQKLLLIRELFALLDGRVLWDGKFDDIPNTVGNASWQVARLGVRMFNVHASAGRRSIEAAVANKGDSLVLGVTVLTSLDPEECVSIFGEEPGPKVLQFARMLVGAGADGIICSPQELELLGQQPDLGGLLKVTPGVRPEWAASGDQRRVMSPRDAIMAGADYLVIGRPIRRPPSEVSGPVEAAVRIAEVIATAMA